MKGWARRTSELHGELAAIADVDVQPAWWLVAGSAAAVEPLRPRSAYMISDAAPTADTFIGLASPAPLDPIRDAIASAHAARAAIRELDGELPDQPLAVTIRRAAGSGAQTIVNSLQLAAFAIGDRCIVAALADDIADEGPLARRLARAEPDPMPVAGVPFVCISIGEEPLATARHGHRRAWVGDAGPWLGVGRAGGLSVVSTCHLAIDGYGHAWLASRLAAHHLRLSPRAPRGITSEPPPALAEVPERVPLGVAWRALPSPAPRALPLAYALGRALHRANQRTGVRFSPTFQIPVAPGEPEDPMRRRRRVVPSTMSVRFEDDEPEPFEAFEARARAIFTREAAGRGLCARLLAAARATPLSLTWKRAAFSTARPRWLDRLAEVVGGRACLSRIRVEFPLGPACAVSSPARLASAGDRLGACVITVIDDGDHAAITVCGSGLAGTHAAAEALIDELLELVGR
ncbi:MAG: hypothetical protein IPQ07_00540 [Myxococcales bacterium]|nr:hypothetical protein [Myxococcales bacterium]